MHPSPPEQMGLDPEARAFYCEALAALHAAGVPFLVGGAYALHRYTGIERHTKDFDIFVRPADRDRALEALAGIGCRTEVTFDHWLGKAYCGENFVDVIYSSGNGLAEVDDDWFAHVEEGEVLGVWVKLCPPEEIIWSKAWVMERERYDGADIAHLLRASAERLDWTRLVRRFGPHWRVLLSHLVLFGFIYPRERHKVPARVMRWLLRRMESELNTTPPEDAVCQGTLISRAQYLVDIEEWGYQDARLRPDVKMTPEDIAEWTAAIEEENATDEDDNGTGDGARRGGR